MTIVNQTDKLLTEHRFEHVADFNADGALDDLLATVDENGTIHEAQITYRTKEGGVAVVTDLQYQRADTGMTVYGDAEPMVSYPSFTISYTHDLQQKFHLQTKPPVSDDYGRAPVDMTADIVGYNGQWQSRTLKQGDMVPKVTLAVNVSAPSAPAFLYYTDATLSEKVLSTQPYIHFPE